MRRFFKPQSFWGKLWLVFVLLLSVLMMGMYGMSRWYKARHAHEPLQLGVTFIPSYAEEFGLDPQTAMQAMIDELGVKRFRLVSYWNRGEPTRDKYDFSELDWQFQKAEQAGVKVSLALGLRQPRWPECHWPVWAKELPDSEWYKELSDYIQAVVQRYQHSPALSEWQLENEYFLQGFGICENHDRQRLVDEYNLVKSLDPDRTLVVTMSNNAIGTPIGEPTPDAWAISVYKRVWDKVSKRNFEYPIPAWYYGFRAGWVEATRGRPVFIHELQAEPWPPNDKRITEVPLAVQDQTMNAQRLTDRIQYGIDTGMRTLDLWGAEWWYWRKVKIGDDSVWRAAQAAFSQ
jgi:hypothetical protein